MSDSPLVAYTRISPNSNNPRANRILKVTPHHMAGNLTLEQFGAIVANPKRQMSANYAIESSGRIGLFCREANRSWCSSSPTNDHMAITVEVANDGGAPNWHVSDKAIAALIDLCTDVCKRNGLDKLVFTGTAAGTVTEHNYFTPTACPGPYLQSKLPYITNEVNRRLQNVKGESTMDCFDVFAQGKRNVQVFATADVNNVAANNIPDGRYQVYEKGIALKNGGGLQGVLIRYNGAKVYAALLAGATELTTISVADAEKRFEWYAGGDASALEQQLEAAKKAQAAAEEQKVAAQKAQRAAEDAAAAVSQKNKAGLAYVQQAQTALK